MDAQIELDHVVKAFTVREKAGRTRRRRTEVRAVDDVSLSVAAGSAVGYIGPNGAGKSTTIKMLIGILVPSAGEVRVEGRDPSRNRKAVARRIGVVFGQRTQLWWDLPLRDSFELLRHVYRVPAADYQARRDELVDLLEVGPFLATPVRQLSLGQRMRGDLVAALLHAPPILFLDEPTIGLDVIAQHNIQTFLRHYQQLRRITILLTSHYMKDVAALCRRVVVINHGQIVYDGSLSGIVDRFSSHKVLTLLFSNGQLPNDFSRYGEVVEIAEPRGGVDVPTVVITPPRTAAKLIGILNDALASTRAGGTVLLFGGCRPGTVIPLDTHRLHYLELTVKGAYHHRPATFQRALDLLASGRIRSAELLSASSPPQPTAGEAARSRANSASRIRVRPFRATRLRAARFTKLMVRTLTKPAYCPRLPDSIRPP